MSQEKMLWQKIKSLQDATLGLRAEISSLKENTRPNDAKIEELAVKVADGSLLIPNIIIRQFKVKDKDSSSDDCKIIDEQRQFFDDLYLLLSKIIDIDPDLLPKQSEWSE